MITYHWVENLVCVVSGTRATWLAEACRESLQIWNFVEYIAVNVTWSEPIVIALSISMETINVLFIYLFYNQIRGTALR